MFCEHCGKKISQGNQFCEFCGKEQGVNNKTTTSSAASSVGFGSMAKWLSYRNLLGFAAVLIAISLFYYFLIRPIQEKRTYEDCFGALTETEQLPYGLQTSEKNFRLDTCVKSRGASEIRMNFKLENERKAAEQAVKDTEEKRKVEEENAKKQARVMSPYELSNLELTISSIDFLRDNRLSGKEVFTVSGNIKNGNWFNVENVVLHFDVTTDKLGKNKIGETDCSLSTLAKFVVFADTTKKFNQECYFEKGGNWYFHFIKSAEKAL